MAIVTGGAQGIGRAVCEVLSKGGARIVIWDNDKTLGQQTALEVGNKSLAYAVDIADWESVKGRARCKHLKRQDGLIFW